MKYVKFLSLPLAVFLAACSDPLPKCGDPEAVGLLRHLQEEDAQHFFKTLEESVQQKQYNALMNDIGALMSGETSREANRIFANLKRRGVTFERDEQQKPLEYSGFVTENQDEKSKIRQCSALANGEAAITDEKKAIFKNFSVFYELQLADNKKEFTLRLLTSLFPD